MSPACQWCGEPGQPIVVTPAVWRTVKGVKSMVTPDQVGFACAAHQNQLREHSVSRESERAQRAARTRAAKARYADAQETLP